MHHLGTCRYYGLLAQRYCGHHQSWQALYEDCFRKQYAFVHRLETNKLRNVAKFFAHLLATDSISWAVLDTIRITEDDTTSSSRIFIKILFQVSPHPGCSSLYSQPAVHISLVTKDLSWEILMHQRYMRGKLNQVMISQKLDFPQEKHTRIP